MSTTKLKQGYKDSLRVLQDVAKQLPYELKAKYMAALDGVCRYNGELRRARPVMLQSSKTVEPTKSDREISLEQQLAALAGVRNDLKQALEAKQRAIAERDRAQAERDAIPEHIRDMASALAEYADNMPIAASVVSCLQGIRNRVTSPEDSEQLGVGLCVFIWSHVVMSLVGPEQVEPCMSDMPADIFGHMIEAMKNRVEQMLRQKACWHDGSRVHQRGSGPLRVRKGDGE